MEKKGEKTVAIASGGKEKESVTTVISISLTGKRLGQIIILKGKGVKKPKCVVHDVTITYNEKSSWMNSSIMLEWVNFILGPHARRLPANDLGRLVSRECEKNSKNSSLYRSYKRINDSRTKSKFL